MIDNQAANKDYIEFGKRFLDPGKNSIVGLEEIMKLLKFILIKEGQDNSKRELLLKALLSNFILCGIIDSNGNYHPEIFVEAYTKGKMNITSFVKILFS